MNLAEIELIISDVDGTLTDGGLYYGPGGPLQRFHVYDGIAVRLLEEAGVAVAVVSGRKDAALIARLDDLGISNRALGVVSKSEACALIQHRMTMPKSATAFLGDDINDIGGFEACGYAVVVASAPDYMKRPPRIVLKTAAGAGALRELAEMILTSKGLSPMKLARKIFA